MGTRLIVVAIMASGVASASAETVLSKTKTAGGTLQSAAFNDLEASASMFQTTLDDGTPVLYVTWGGPMGYVSGLASLSAAAVQGNRIALDLDAGSLLTTYYASGTPGPCVGTFEAAAYDGVSYFYSTDTTGNRTTVYFQPFGGMPGGIQYETKTAGRTADSTARFSGTCAGATVNASSPYQTGYRASQTGNVTLIVKQLP